MGIFKFTLWCSASCYFTSFFVVYFSLYRHINCTFAYNSWNLFFKKEKATKKGKVEDAKKDPPLLKVFSFGFFMNLANYSSVPLLFVASKDVGLTGMPFDYQMVLLLMICLIMNIMVEIPLLFYLVQKKNASKVLRKANILFTAKGNLIIAIYLIVIAIYLLWRALNVLKIL